MTIMTVPSRQTTLLVIVCDECKRDLQVATDQVSTEGTALPFPWREVEMRGWIGAMHACCDSCEMAVRDRHEETTAVTPAPAPLVEFDDEDTKP